MTTERNRFRRTGVARAVITVLCGTASMLVATETFAQAQSGTTLQRVEVTGTNVRRSDTETPSPVQVITRQELEQSGKATVGEYLQTLTSDGQGSVPTTYGRGFSGATASGISLRGLGANATLVLVNGRRVAPAVLADDAQRAFVDLNSLPMEAVDRIEVVKDGASALYGSDAVAGVVNIILFKSFVGTRIKATYGISEEGDGGEPRVAITHGRGDLDKDGWNLLLNLEAGKKDAMYYRDRGGNIGRSVLTPDGIPASTTGSNNIARAGGNGVIPTNAAGVPLNNSTTQSIIGNVVPQPATGNPTTPYVSRGNANIPNATRAQPGAQAYCNANANLAQNDPGGGCITDMWKQLGQIHPESESLNLYGRFTKRLGTDTEAWIEAGYYQTSSRVENTARVPNGTILNPNGSLSSNLANFLIGANHPDNPFNQNARLSYNPGLEIGAGITDSESKSFRFQTGLKSTIGAWDLDTAFSYSQAEQTDTVVNAINWRVANALMNPSAANVAAAQRFPGYAALPAGTLWRIAENANLNSPALYDALLDDKSRDGKTKYMSLDAKVSREIGQMEGGPIGLALGAEIRREESNLGLYEGLGDYIGLSYTTYGGKRTVSAVFAEVNLPVTKRIEANIAARYDHYSDAGNAFTPKFGAKWRVLDNLALRGTYAHSFRAPSFTENGINSLAAFGGPTVNDRVRVAAGVPTASAVAPAFLQRGNPDLEPEKAKSFTIGTVWDILPTSSVTLDYFQIKRKGLPVIEAPQDAVDAGRITRDPSQAQNPNDPGPILQGFVQFVNANQSTTRGIEVEAKHRMNLGDGMGRLNFGANWTHLLEQSVTQSTGTKYEYAGSHGDCHITNCIGSPRNKIRLWTTWEWNAWTVTGTVNYRGPMSARDPQDHPNGCAWTRPDGTPLPEDCKIKSFTTLDMSASWKIRQNTELLLGINNVFDTKPPFDPVTYGAIGYNPLDYSGAIGRYYRVGLKHKF